MDAREERAARNEAHFRQVNESIDELTPAAVKTLLIICVAVGVLEAAGDLVPQAVLVGRKNGAGASIGVLEVGCPLDRDHVTDVLDDHAVTKTTNRPAPTAPPLAWAGSPDQRRRPRPFVTCG